MHRCFGHEKRVKRGVEVLRNVTTLFMVGKECLETSLWSCFRKSFWRGWSSVTQVYENFIRKSVINVHMPGKG